MSDNLLVRAIESAIARADRIPLKKPYDIHLTKEVFLSNRHEINQLIDGKADQVRVVLHE